jgi:hypothetical protein
MSCILGILDMSLIISPQTLTVSVMCDSRNSCKVELHTYYCTESYQVKFGVHVSKLDAS